MKRDDSLQKTLKRERFRMNGKSGFTLVELVVVVAIVAILAVVATPAYMNYVNRTKQGQGVSMLLTARLEQEEFYTDNGRYASTIQCLPSFVSQANTTACLSNCANCPANSATLQYYSFQVTGFPTANTQYYQITAQRQIYSGQPLDVMTISSNTSKPTIQNTEALKFSVFQWLFQ